MDKAKLKTERGATLMLALLLFMVCCAVGIVVLTAGTASAGRTAELAKMDRRYYSVTSAANLLAELVDGKTVTVSQRRNVEEIISPGVNPEDPPDVSYNTTYESPRFIRPAERPVTGGGLSILEQAAYYLCIENPYDGTSVLENAAGIQDVWESRKIPQDYAGGNLWSLALTLDTANTASPALKAELENALDVKINMALLKDGSLGFIIKNAVKAADEDNPNPDQNVYTLYLHCPCKAVTTPKPTDDHASATKTTTITWTAGEISARKNWTETV